MHLICREANESVVTKKRAKADLRKQSKLWLKFDDNYKNANFIEKPLVLAKSQLLKSREESSHA